jgi:hypothetical protein
VLGAPHTTAKAAPFLSARSRADHEQVIETELKPRAGWRPGQLIELGTIELGTI